MRAFDMQGLIRYVSLITCNQSLFDHAPDECGFDTIAMCKVNSNFLLIDFLYFGLPHTRTGRGRCSETDSMCQVMYTPIWINYSSLCSLSRIGHHLVHTSKSSLSWFSVPFSELAIMPSQADEKWDLERKWWKQEKERRQQERQQVFSKLCLLLCLYLYL